MDYLKELPIWPFTIVAALIGVLGAIIAQHISRYHTAAVTFRNTIHVSLKGIYPAIELHLSSDEINAQILQSIPNIQLAVNEFSTFVPFHRKSGFNNAAQNYYKTARNTDWNIQHANQMFPSMKKNGCLSPKEIFIHAVKELLSYAK